MGQGGEIYHRKPMPPLLSADIVVTGGGEAFPSLTDAPGTDKPRPRKDSWLEQWCPRVLYLKRDH